MRFRREADEMEPRATMLYRLRGRAALLLFLFTAFAFFLPAAAEAQGAGKEVRVGWYESPFNTAAKSGRRTDYAYEYQQKLAAYTGWHYTYVRGSWPELLQMLADGKLDAYISLNAYTDPERLLPVGKIGASDFFFAVSRSRPDLLEDLNAAMRRIQDENPYYNQHRRRPGLLLRGGKEGYGALFPPGQGRRAGPVFHGQRGAVQLYRGGFQAHPETGVREGWSMVYDNRKERS